MICSGVWCFRFAIGCPPGVQGALSQPRWTRFRGAGQCDLDAALKYYRGGFKIWTSSSEKPSGRLASKVQRYFGDLCRLRGALDEADKAYVKAMGYLDNTVENLGEKGKVLSSQAELYSRYARHQDHL